MIFSHRFGDELAGFADYLQISEDGNDGLLVRNERVSIHAVDESLDLIGRVDHVFDVIE